MGTDHVSASLEPSKEAALKEAVKKIGQEADTWSFEANGFEDGAIAVGMGVPLIIASCSKIIQQLLVSVLMGRRNTVLLASVSVASIFSSWLDEATSQGAVQAGVLCGQAYGAGNYSLVGIWLQMQLIFMTCCFPVVLAFKFSTGHILAFLGVPAIIAEPAGIYATWSSFAVLFELWYNAIQAYFLAQGIVRPDAIINVIFIVITTFFIWVGVYFLHWGIYGVALAMSLKRFLRCSTLVGFCYLMGYHAKTWKGWNWKECFKKDRWKILLGMTLPAMIGTIFEQSQWSVNSIFAARLGPVSSAAYDLIVLLLLLLYQVVWGMSQGFGMCMAQALGRGQPNKAHGMVIIGASISYTLVLLISVAVYFLLPLYASIASKDPEVREEIAKVKLISALTVLSCGGMFMSGEVLIKQGRVAVVFLSIVLGQWFIGLPLGFFLSPIYGISGILCGNLVAYIGVHGYLAYSVWHTDWKELTKQAQINAEISDVKSRSNSAAEADGEGRLATKDRSRSEGRLASKDRSRSSSFADESFTITIRKASLASTKAEYYAENTDYEFSIHDTDERGALLFKLVAQGNGTAEVAELKGTFTTKSSVVAFKSKDKVTTLVLRSFRGKKGEPQEAVIDLCSPWNSDVVEQLHLTVQGE